MMERTTFSEYEAMLSEPMGARLTERILDHASNNPSITLKEMVQLVKIAYPDDV